MIINIVCNKLEDNDLCGLVRSAIEEKWGFDEIESGAPIPRTLKIIIIAEAYDGFAQVNGFNSLMCMMLDPEFLEEAYREVGATELAEIVRESIEFFRRMTVSMVTNTRSTTGHLSRSTLLPIPGLRPKLTHWKLGILMSEGRIWKPISLATFDPIEPLWVKLNMN